jgi:hypothetical protein
MGPLLFNVVIYIQEEVHICITFLQFLGLWIKPTSGPSVPSSYRELMCMQGSLRTHGNKLPYKWISMLSRYHSPVLILDPGSIPNNMKFIHPKGHSVVRSLRNFTALFPFNSLIHPRWYVSTPVGPLMGMRSTSVCNILRMGKYWYFRFSPTFNPVTGETKYHSYQLLTTKLDLWFELPTDLRSDILNNTVDFVNLKDYGDGYG